MSARQRRPSSRGPNRMSSRGQKHMDNNEEHETDSVDTADGHAMSTGLGCRATPSCPIGSR
jgi:hypothetical protein